MLRWFTCPQTVTRPIIKGLTYSNQLIETNTLLITKPNHHLGLEAVCLLIKKLDTCGVAVWHSDNTVGCINKVALCRAGLVLRWVTIRGYTILDKLYVVTMLAEILIVLQKNLNKMTHCSNKKPSVRWQRYDVDGNRLPSHSLSRAFANFYGRTFTGQMPCLSSNQQNQSNKG